MAEKRAGLKEIAELAGMSIGNVSMVLSGRGDTARISKASQQKVFDAAKELNYKPNVYAKRLRTNNSGHIIIAVFFASSKNVAVIGSFFSGIHELLSDESFAESRPELVLYPYNQGQLRSLDQIVQQGCFHGAIFMGMSSDDFEYVENLTISQPVVVFNRVSARHHYVFTDNASIGKIAAQIFYKHGCRNVFLVTGHSVSPAGAQRRQGFIDECGKLGLSLPPDHILQVNPRFEGGKEAAFTIIERNMKPDALFFSEAFMVSGALHWLLLQNNSIFKKTVFATYSGDSIGVENYIPGLSTIRMPMEDMSRDCLLLLLRAIHNPEFKHMNIMHKPITVIRD